LHAARPGGLKKKSTHATLHFPAGSFGLASWVPSIKPSSQYYSQSSSQSLCGMTVAIFQRSPLEKKNVSKYSTYAFFPNKKGMSPDWFHPLSEWAALLTWVAFWLAKSIEQVAVEILLNSRGEKNPRTRVSCWDDAQVFNRSQHFVGDGSGRGKKNKTFVKWKPTIFESLIGSPCSILASNMGHRSSPWSFS
jgi:hypothetical protein